MYSRSSATYEHKLHTVSVCSDRSIHHTCTFLLTPAHIQTTKDKIILSEHLPMFSSDVFAQYRRSVLSASKDLEFQKCSSQRRQNTGYSDYGGLQYSSASADNRRRSTSVILRLLRPKSFPLYPSLITLHL